MKRHIISGLVGVALCILSHFINLEGAILMGALLLCFAIVNHTEKITEIWKASVEPTEAPDKLEPKE